MKSPYLKKIKLMNLENFPSWFKIIECIGNLKLQKIEPYQSLVAKRTDVTFSHCTSVLKAFIHNDMIKINKVGRISYIKLTPKGLAIRKAISLLYKGLEK